MQHTHTASRTLSGISRILSGLSTAQWTKILLFALAIYAIDSLLFGLEALAQSDRVILSTQRFINLERCWFCGPIFFLYNHVIAIGIQFWAILAPAVYGIFPIILALWILFYVVRAFAPFGPMLDAQAWSILLWRFLLAAIIFAILSNVSFFWEWIVIPIFSLSMFLIQSTLSGFSSFGILDYIYGVPILLISYDLPAYQVGDPMDVLRFYSESALQLDIQVMGGNPVLGPGDANSTLRIGDSWQHLREATAGVLEFDSLESLRNIIYFVMMMLQSLHQIVGPILAFFVEGYTSRQESFTNGGAALGGLSALVSGPFVVLIFIVFTIMIVFFTVAILDAFFRLLYVGVTGPFLLAFAFFPQTRAAFYGGLVSVFRGALDLFIVFLVIFLLPIFFIMSAENMTGGGVTNLNPAAPEQCANYHSINPSLGGLLRLQTMTSMLWGYHHFDCLDSYVFNAGFWSFIGSAILAMFILRAGRKMVEQMVDTAFQQMGKAGGNIASQVTQRVTNIAAPAAVAGVGAGLWGAGKTLGVASKVGRSAAGGAGRAARAGGGARAGRGAVGAPSSSGPGRAPSEGTPSGGGAGGNPRDMRSGADGGGGGGGGGQGGPPSSGSPR